jgi:hypothetical protein
MIPGIYAENWKGKICGMGIQIQNSDLKFIEGDQNPGALDQRAPKYFFPYKDGRRATRLTRSGSVHSIQEQLCILACIPCIGHIRSNIHPPNFAFVFPILSVNIHSLRDFAHLVRYCYSSTRRDSERRICSKGISPWTGKLNGLKKIMAAPRFVDGCDDCPLFSSPDLLVYF